MIVSPEPFEGEALDTLIDCAQVAFERKFHYLKNPSEHPYKAFLSNPKDLLFGLFHVPRINGTGFWMCSLPSNERDSSSSSSSLFTVKKDTIRIVLVWQRGDVDILVKESTDEKVDGCYVTSQTVFKNEELSSLSSSFEMKEEISKTASNDFMRLSISSIRPLQYTDENVLPNLVTDNNETSDVLTSAASDAGQPAMEVSVFDDPLKYAISLKKLKIEFEKLNIEEDLFPFLLTYEMLEMMGFVLDNTFIQFLDSSDSVNWKMTDLPPVANGRGKVVKVQGQKDEVEEGEEMEEEDDDDSSENEESVSPDAAMSIFIPVSLKQKLKKEAIQLYLDDENQSVATSVYPLNVCSIDCEMCSTRDGLELTRITILHPIHGIILDCLVRPKLPIIDYHSEFSGVTQQSLQNVSNAVLLLWRVCFFSSFLLHFF
jgi:hypothetical protein